MYISNLNICTYTLESIKSQEFGAGLDYGEEVHWSVKNFNPRQVIWSNGG